MKNPGDTNLHSLIHIAIINGRFKSLANYILITRPKILRQHIKFQHDLTECIGYRLLAILEQTEDIKKNMLSIVSDYIPHADK